MAISSDKGLCGACHTQICKRIKAEIAETDSSAEDVGLVCVGDKARAQLARYVSENR